MSVPELRSVVRLDRQPSIRDTVKRALRSAIISGDMQPGQVYSAPSLGDQFGVSATPVREAMLDLVREGLVIAVPNRGFRVTEVSADDLREVTDLRLFLEPPAIERATPLIPEEDFPALRAQADDIVAGAEEGDLVRYLNADSDFHLALLRYAGNARLIDLITSLRSQTRLFGLSALLQRGQLRDSASEHHAMIDAIEARDASLARRLVHKHIEHVLTDWSGAPPGRE
ncbi:MAG TPA: GntR family transcriptional regulator [Microbacterium sp.]|jgi:DNA-binding GntR family transcriptional regulator|uniref:GntR family transcriptional regulator n=1 Tax=Microbacterium arabinogalactanolyticum TaxID=69365 RepID=UPI0025551388|nr:GntR family transcriptional regulator [Microbacterium arabinogalactanolyticum]GLC86471.1 GntR family transcriptional regulator [Microbacterium arabinogalactanolyticum]HWU29711.1 GntR family transcriptional regulator [Microbacterium sp.]